MNRVLHTAADFEEAVSALSAPQLARLARAARMLASALDMSWEDLYQQAYADCLGLSRSRPGDVDVVKFLIETMRSIASTRRRSMAVAQRLSAVGPTRSAPGSAGELIAGDGKIVQLHPEPETPEQVLLRREDEAATQAWLRARHQELLELFDDDEEAQLMVLGMLDGLRGRELMDATGLDEARFPSKYKKVHRRIENLKGRRS